MNFDQSISLPDLREALSQLQRTRQGLEDALRGYEMNLANQQATGSKDSLFKYLQDQSQDLKKIATDSIESLTSVEKWIKEEINRLEEAEYLKNRIISS
jgi:hypothetical protein